MKLARVSVLLVCLCVLSSSAVQATTLTFVFTATVTSNTPNPLGINLGDSVVGSMTFDPSTPDLNASLTVGRYVTSATPDVPFPFQFSVHGYEFKYTTMQQTIGNGVPDSYAATGGGAGSLLPAGVTTPGGAMFSIVYTDPTMITSDLLPTTPLPLINFSPSSTALTLNYLFTPPGGTGTMGFMRATFSSFEPAPAPVPEPATLTLIGLGVAGAVTRRQERRARRERGVQLGKN